MLAPNPTIAAPVWPIAGDVPDLLAIVIGQAGTIASQEALLHAYQGNLTPAATPATGTGAIVTASTSLAVSAVTGTIVTGAVVTGSVIAGTVTVLGQISGTTGGAGTYLMSAPVTLAAAAVLTFTPPAGSSSWPVPRDAYTLNLIVQIQTAVLRTQSALLQHYQDLLNTSQVAAPPTGP